MADVTLTVQQLSRAGVAPNYQTLAATGNTYHVPNNGGVFLHFVKSGAGDATITLQTAMQVAGLAVADPTVTVTASNAAGKMVGPFPVDVFNAGGELLFTASEVTGLTCAPIRVY